MNCFSTSFVNSVEADFCFMHISGYGHVGKLHDNWTVYRYSLMSLMRILGCRLVRATLQQPSRELRLVINTPS